MTNRRLGPTDIWISPIGLGCWQFSGGQGFVGRYWPVLEPAAVRDMVESSLEAGVNWFDTAEAYGRGASERALAGALRELGRKPGEVVVATKWMPALRTARTIPRTMDRRQQEALGEYPIDLYQIHNPYSVSSLEAQLREMTALSKAGKIRAIAYSPLAQGVLGGAYHEDPQRIRERPGMRKRLRAFRFEQLARMRPLIEELRRIGEAQRVTPAEVALSWLVSAHGDTVAAIPGASSAEQARRNAAAMSLRLSDKELEDLTQLSAVPAGASVA